MPLFIWLVIVLAAFSLIVFLSSLKYITYIMSKTFPDMKLRVNLFVPCKGMEPNLLENLKAYASQEYSNYQVIFVTATDDDPAIEVIREIISLYPHCKHMAAGINNNYSQKINNLIMGTERYNECDIFAFGDSDIAPEKKWLSRLISPLKNPKIGATTGYRWYWKNKRSFFENIVIMWNGFIIFFMLLPFYRFIWGGTYAVRRDLFNNMDVRNVWNNVVTEDFTLTAVIRSHGYKIHFVPNCISLSYFEFNFLSGVEWTTRQLLLSKFYFQRLFIGTLIFGIFGFLAFVLLFPLYLIAFLMFGLIIVGITRFIFRLLKINIKISYFMSLYLIASCVLLFVNIVMALFSHKLKWRNVTYHILSANKMRVETA